MLKLEIILRNPHCFYLKMANDVPTNALDIKTKIGYAAGYICLGITLAIYIPYCMLFFQSVINIESQYVGIIFLIGQITDGVSALIVGFLSDLDLNVSICHTYGRRKVNHQLLSNLSIYFLSVKLLSSKTLS